MPEELDLDRWRWQENVAPEGEDALVWKYRKAILEKCTLPERPPHALSKEVAEDLTFFRHCVDTLIPEAFTRDDAFAYFLTREHPMGGYYMLGPNREIRFDSKKATEAMHSSQYLPGYWYLDRDELLASYRRSLDPEHTLHSGWVDFPTRDSVTVRLGRRRTSKPPAESVAEGLYYSQFAVEDWSATYAAPQLFAAIEKHCEDGTDEDPFDWVQRRASIATGYSIVGIGKDCSGKFLAGVYESMASTVCNTAPKFQDEVREFAVGEEEQDLLMELYGRHAATACPEAVATVLAHAMVLDPERMRESATLRAFFDRLPQLLENGLNIDRIEEYTRAECSEEGTLFQRLESGMRMALHVYGGTEKPWWFKEDFDMGAYFVEDKEPDREGRFCFRNTHDGRQALEQLAQYSGFALQHVLEPYCAVGYRLAELQPFSREDAMRFTAETVCQYGIGNPRRAIGVLWNCLGILHEEAPLKRPQRLTELRAHLEDVRPATPTIGKLEALRPVFALPGIERLAATMLDRAQVDSGRIHAQRIGFDELRAIGAKFSEPVAVRAATYAPALPRHARDMERRGLLPGQSAEAKRLLPVAETHTVTAPTANPILGVMDFYQQLRDECSSTDTDTANLYFRFCAARMPDPWHPPKGFLRFLQLFDDIETPGWRFAGLEHPDDREEVHEQNSRRHIDKQMLVANMLDAWSMGLLTAQELETLCAWLTADIAPQQRTAAEKDVLWNWRDRLRDAGKPQRQPDSETDDWEALRSTDEDAFERMRRNDRAKRAGKTLSPEEDAAPVTAEDREQTVAEECEQDVRSTLSAHTAGMRKNRMMALQETFGTLSVINSMAIAGAIPHAALRAMLQDSVLPQVMRTVETDVEGADAARPRAAGVLLSNLVRLQEMGALDTEALRHAVEQSETAEEAYRVAQDFLGNVLQRCMERSINESVPQAIARVTEAMQAVTAMPNAEEAAEELQRTVAVVRHDLEQELHRIWDGAPFVAADIVDRLLTEFRVPQYTALFRNMQHFNRNVLPHALPPPPREGRFADLHASNQHTARTFHFVGSRIVQEYAGDRDERRGLSMLARRHGANSRVNMEQGVSMVRDLALRPSNDEPSDLDPADMYAALASRLPEFLGQVERWRLADVPLGPIGGRWHFGNPVSEKHLKMFTHLMSLGQTPFRMIHSNTSLIIPGFMSKNEMRLFIFMLALEGLLDPSKPELQLGITGRLSPELCAYFGSACMLGTAQCPPFKLDSFVPDQGNHHLTAARIVAYDAYPESGGERKNFELPFMFQGSPQSGKNVFGRTDILGRWDVRWKPANERPTIDTMDDLDIAHVVGAALRHVQHGGPLGDAGLAFMARHREILARYNLTDTLHAPWVYARGEHEAYEDSSKNPEHFNRCVKACMDVHFAQAGNFASGTGAVFEVRENTAMLMRAAEEVGQQIQADPAYSADVRALLLQSS